MATNLLDISRGHFTDIAIAKAANFLGENSAATYKAVNFILPALLGGMANKSSSSEGVNELIQHLKASNEIDMSVPLGTLMGGGAPTQTLMNRGSSIISSVFDNRTGFITDWIASATHIKTASVSSLMNMVSPILLNLIGRRGGASAGSFARLMNEQLPILRNANIPEGLVKAANLDFTTSVTTRVDDDGAKANIDFGKFVPWVLGGLGILVGSYFLKKCASDSASTKPIVEKPAAPTTATAPVATTATAATATAATPKVVVDSVHKLTLPEGSIDIPKGSFLDKLYTEITDVKADLTKPLTLDSVYFKNASARLTPESRNQVDELSKILKAYPNVEIKIDGHTDNFGIPAKNLHLSNIRAASVKRYLIRSGIAAERIATEGFGDTKPVGDNATPEGMAKNRRIEVFVTKK